MVAGLFESVFGCRRRRGSVAVLVAIGLVVLFGFAALTVDVGMMYNARADLQRAADAGALAACEVLATSSLDDDPLAAPRQTAKTIVESNPVLGDQVTIEPATDVVFGRARYHLDTNSFTFSPTTVKPNAVRVTVRHTDDSPNGPVPLAFAAIFGKHTTNISATAVATAAGAPRDMAVVIDLSASMNDDSELRNAELGQINLRDIWAALDGPVPARPYFPGAENETEYAFDSGPAIGVMQTWGDPIIPGAYDPESDPGLWRIARGSDCTEPAALATLLARGYSATEATTLLRGTTTTSEWRARTAVILGLANWHSGYPGGYAPAGGDADGSVESGELTWTPLPGFAHGWTWSNYIDYVASSATWMAQSDAAYRYRYGVKTFTNFLLETQHRQSDTDLYMTPMQPLQAVKDGLQAMIDVGDAEFDQVSLEVYSEYALHEIDLSHDIQGAVDRLYGMQAGHYASLTNIGAGIQNAIDELSSERARDNVQKVIALLSDGIHNTGPDPIEAAQRAADEGFRIYTISVGYGADRELMQQIAAITDGQEFFAAGSPSEYTRQLREIFQKVGTLGRISLIE